MVVVLLLILFVLVFGIGALLKLALWTIVLSAIVVVGGAALLLKKLL